MSRRLLIAAAALALLCASFVAGRYSRPARVETVTVEKRVVEVREVKVAEQTKQAQTRWRTKVVTRPDGTRVETATTDRAEASHAQRRNETSARAEDDRRIVTVPAPLPRWSVGANVGLGLDGRLRYGGEVSRRVAGPLWLGVQADVPTRSAALTARLTW